MSLPVRLRPPLRTGTVVRRKDTHMLGITAAAGNNSYVSRGHITAVTANLNGPGANFGTTIGRRSLRSPRLNHDFRKHQQFATRKEIHSSYSIALCVVSGLLLGVTVWVFERIREARTSRCRSQQVLPQ